MNKLIKSLENLKNKIIDNKKNNNIINNINNNNINDKTKRRFKIELKNENYGINELMKICDKINNLTNNSIRDTYGTNEKITIELITTDNNIIKIKEIYNINYTRIKRGTYNQ